MCALAVLVRAVICCGCACCRVADPRRAIDDAELWPLGMAEVTRARPPRLLEPCTLRPEKSSDGATADAAAGDAVLLAPADSFDSDRRRPVEERVPFDFASEGDDEFDENDSGDADGAFSGVTNMASI